MTMQQGYHGYPGRKAEAAKFRQQVQRNTHRAGEAAKLRRSADRMEEDIRWLVGEVEGCAERYGDSDSMVQSGRATITRLLADQRALYGRAVAIEQQSA